MADRLTDAVTAGVAYWASRAMSRLDDEKLQVVEATHADPAADFQITFRLKEGVVRLDAVNTVTNQRFELHRVDVAPRRGSALKSGSN